MRDGDPQVVAAPIFVVGSIALGLQLLEWPSAGALGSPLAIILGGTGLMLLVCTVWAAALGQSFVACFCGTFGGFWISYGIFVLGVLHNWWGFVAPDGTVLAEDLYDSVAIFALCWALFFLFITIASVRLPIIYTAIFGLVVVALVLVFIAYLVNPPDLPREGVLNIAGVVVLVFAALGMSLSLTVMNLSLGAPASPPLGKPIVKAPPAA